MFYGMLSKYLTIGGVGIGLLLILFTALQKDCTEEINTAVEKAIQNERLNFKTLNDNVKSIECISDDDFDKWLQSNGRYRE